MDFLIFHRSILALLTILFFSFSSYSQKNVRAYNKNINKAELAICKAQYTKADKFYDKAFENKKPFWIDLYRATLLNHHCLNNTQKAINYSIILAELGNFSYTWFIEEKDTLENITLYHVYKTIKDTTTIIFDKNLKNVIDSIRQSDQEIRNERLFSDDDDDDIWEQKIKYVDSINFCKLKSLYKKYGTINEYNMGMEAMRNIWSFFLHFYKVLDVNPESFLLKEFLSGNFDVREYANLMDICKSFSKGNDSHFQKKEYATGLEHYFLLHNTFFILDPSNIKLINKNRKEIGLYETWNDFKIKVQYSFSQKKSPIKFYFIQEIIGDQEEDAKYEQDLIKQIQNKEIKGSYYTKDF